MAASPVANRGIGISEMALTMALMLVNIEKRVEKLYLERACARTSKRNAPTRDLIEQLGMSMHSTNAQCILRDGKAQQLICKRSLSGVFGLILNLNPAASTDSMDAQQSQPKITQDIVDAAKRAFNPSATAESREQGLCEYNELVNR